MASPSYGYGRPRVLSVSLQATLGLERLGAGPKTEPQVGAAVTNPLPNGAAAMAFACGGRGLVRWGARPGFRVQRVQFVINAAAFFFAGAKNCPGSVPEKIFFSAGQRAPPARPLKAEQGIPVPKNKVRGDLLTWITFLP